MIAIIENYGQYTHRIWRTLKEIGVKAEIIENTTPVGEIKRRQFAGIIFSGGPSLERVGNCLEILERYEEFGIPLLGICLGHQLIAKYFGGEVGRGKKAEYSLIEVEILKENDLFVGIPRILRVWASHMDEVKSMPKDFELLARRGANSARLRRLNTESCQFTGYSSIPRWRTRRKVRRSTETSFHSAKFSCDLKKERLEFRNDFV
jgi:GMP synthase (glutamine-hydrolysing)